jgi:hypothetical protein
MGDCYDPIAFDGLKKLANEYTEMAAVLWREESEKDHADAAKR